MGEYAEDEILSGMIQEANGISIEDDFHDRGLYEDEDDIMLDDED